MQRKMSSTGTKRSRNRGIASTLGSQKFKRSNSSESEKISKYFAKVPKNEEAELSDSPYKNCLNKVKSVKLDNTASDLDDFKTPTAINKVSKIINSKAPPNNAKKRKKTTQPRLRKFVEDNLKFTDVNPDHLQIALALSESSYESENPNATLTSQDKKASFKEAFEKYGFGYSKNKLFVQEKKEAFEKRKNKKSRFRFITPTLKIRTEEERQSLISSKVSLILAQNRGKTYESVTQNGALFCDSLGNYRGSKIFELNCLELWELNETNKFYVSGLHLGSGHACCGHLLKDWRKIPGREPTPERNSVSVATPSDHVNGMSSENRLTEDLPPPIGVSNSGDHSTPIFIKNTTDKTNRILRLSVDLHEQDISFESGKPEEFNLYKSQASPTISCVFKTDRMTESRKLRLGATLYGDLSESLGDITEPREEEKITKITSPVWEKMHKSETSEETIIGETLISSFNKISPVINNWENSQGQGTKRSFECVSPDLFDSDDDSPSFDLRNHETPTLNRLRGGLSLSTEIECYDLTHSDEDQKEEETNQREKRFQVRLSELGDSVDQRSDLNITDYVEDLLSNYKEETKKKLEKISTSEEESQPSQNSIYISDDELNYSSVFSSPPKKNIKYDFSDDDDFGLCCGEIPLAERIKGKSLPEDNFDSNKTSPIHYGQEHLPLEASFEPPNIKSGDKFSPLQSPLEKLPEETNRQALILNPETSNKNSPPTFTPTLEDSFKTEILSCDYGQEQIPLEDSFFYHPPDTPIVKSPDKFSTPLEQQPQSLSLRYRLLNEILPPEIFSKTPTSGQTTTPTLEDSFNNVLSEIPANYTPSSGFVIKTKNVTPMANYDEMDTPKIAKELDRFGLKPLKRQKGAKLLRYIYESTHPLVENENPQISKKHGNIPQSGEIIIGEIPEDGDFIFERKQSKKVASCAVPLHIVWYNFVMSNPKVRECILLYEPLQLEVLHSMLKDQGYKFNIQDLLTFLDRKCVTIRTAQGQHHGGRRVK